MKKKRNTKSLAILEGHIFFGSDTIQIRECEASCASRNHWSKTCTNSLDCVTKENNN